MKGGYLWGTYSLRKFTLHNRHIYISPLFCPYTFSLYLAVSFDNTELCVFENNECQRCGFWNNIGYNYMCLRMKRNNPIWENYLLWLKNQACYIYYLYRWMNAPATQQGAAVGMFTFIYLPIIIELLL